MKLNYHRRAFVLVNHDPQPANRDLLAEFSTKGGLAMPESVSEFYSVRESVNLLRKYSNDDSVLLPSQFEITPIGNQPAITFIVENQACCEWAFAFDGSNDPPVLVGEEQAENPLGWTPTGATFSEFVYLRFFDFQFFLQLPADAEYFFDARPMSNDELREIEGLFHREKSTHDWPSPKHRFRRGDQRIVVFAANDCWQWHCHASSPASQASLFSELKHLCHELIV